MKKTKIISCVGQRALALVTPIYSLLKHFKINEAELTLLYTNQITEEVAEKSKSWFEGKGLNLIFNKVKFSKDKTFLESLWSYDENIYFNVNPGMNWQIALLSLYLPEHTICFSSDVDNLYCWNIMEDTSSAKTYELLSLGLNSYNELSNNITVDRKDGIKPELSKEIKDCLETIKKKEQFFIRSSKIPSEILDKINKHIAWIRETKGMLYILFDLININPVGSEEIELRSLFRLITEIFDPLNFFLTIITDNATIGRRSEIEGVDFIISTKKGWTEEVERWILHKRKIKPKNIAYENFERPELKLSLKIDSNDKTLFTCLGDNVETTLKAILSHPAKNIGLIYDKNSRRIALLAENVAKNVMLSLSQNKKIELISSDHNGANLLNQLSKFDKFKNCEFNITPGTKTQTLVLSIIARKLNKVSSVFSIDNSKNKVVSIINGIDYEIVPPEVDLLIRCQLSEKKEISKEDLNLELSEIISRELSEEKIISNSSLLKITSRTDKKKIFELIDEKTLKHLPTERNFTIDPLFIDKEKSKGVWWEAVVKYLVEKNLGSKAYWRVKWRWPFNIKDNSAFFTELDVVSQYEGHILVFSCKTSPYENLEIESFLLRSEARKRFGRMALCFIAVPFENMHAKPIAGHMINDVKVLTPKILYDSERLKGQIKKLINSLRTTSQV